MDNSAKIAELANQILQLAQPPKPRESIIGTLIGISYISSGNDPRALFGAKDHQTLKIYIDGTPPELREVTVWAPGIAPLEIGKRYNLHLQWTPDGSYDQLMSADKV